MRGNQHTHTHTDQNSQLSAAHRHTHTTHRDSSAKATSVRLIENVCECAKENKSEENKRVKDRERERHEKSRVLYRERRAVVFGTVEHTQRVRATFARLFGMTQSHNTVRARGTVQT